MNIQYILDKYNIKCSYDMLLSMWNENHRHYHNQSHLSSLIEDINNNIKSYSEKEYEKLILLALFHDIIYIPENDNNEEESANFLISLCKDKECPHIKEIYQSILDSKEHRGESWLSNEFNKYDMNIVEKNYESLLEWENGISKEYSFLGENYKIKRLEFLNSLLNKYPNNTSNLLDIINYVKNK